MLRFDNRWVWDSWLADDGQDYHLFFLQAPRNPTDPDLRHFQVSIGHARSSDLYSWEELPTALRPAETPAWDDYTTWTGSIVRAPDGVWRMFYTGTSRAEQGRVQRIGAAESDDLISWRRVDQPSVEADPRWYERLADTSWPDEAWRDPFVFRDPDGDGWHMLVTARANHGAHRERGVIGHARSDDLIRWQVMPPLTSPGHFGHLEVPQVVDMDGVATLVFSCHASEMPTARRVEVGSRGVWSVSGPTLLGPFDASRAEAFDHPSLYAARLVQDRGGRWNLLGFSFDVDGAFVGEIIDPIPVRGGGAPLTPTIGRRSPARA